MFYFILFNLFFFLLSILLMKYFNDIFSLIVLSKYGYDSDSESESESISFGC
jgi:hypothetical protein